MPTHSPVSLVDSVDEKHMVSKSPLLLLFLTETEDMRQLQLDNPLIGIVFKSKLQNSKPPDPELKAYIRDTRRLYQILDQLLVRDDKLHRQYQKQDDKPTSVMIPECKKTEVISEMHGATLGGHLGEEKTLACVRERFYWPGYHNDVRDWCKMCAACAASKTPAPKNRAQLQRVKVGSPMQMVAVDIMHPFP